MKKDKRLIFLEITAILIAVAGLCCHGYKHFFTGKTLLGTYVNQHEHRSSASIITVDTDTLTLLANNRFTSSNWGKGTYKTSYTITGTHIELIYNYGSGKDGFEAPVTRLDWGKPAILLNRVGDYYYERID